MTARPAARCSCPTCPESMIPSPSSWTNASTARFMRAAAQLDPLPRLIVAFGRPRERFEPEGRDRCQSCSTPRRVSPRTTWNPVRLPGPRDPPVYAGRRDRVAVHIAAPAQAGARVGCRLGWLAHRSGVPERAPRSPGGRATKRRRSDALRARCRSPTRWPQHKDLRPHRQGKAAHRLDRREAQQGGDRQPTWLLDQSPPALEQAGRHIVVAIIHPCLTCLVSP